MKDRKKSESRSLIVFVVFSIFLIFCMIGTNPFPSPNIYGVREVAPFDSVVRLVLVPATVIFFSLIRAKREGAGLISIAPAVGLVFIWCFATAIWSVAPVTTLVRLTLTVLSYYAMYSYVKIAGPSTAIRDFSKIVAMVVAVSFISCFFIRNAIHQHGDPAEVVGAWRGLFAHKNNAGSFAAISVICSTFYFRRERKSSWLVSAAVSFIFLLMTTSKTSWALLLPAAAVAMIAPSLMAQRGSMRALALCSLLVFCAVVFGLLIWSEPLQVVLQDPRSFTNRAQIWRSMYEAFSTNPIGGVGFGALWQVDRDVSLIRGATMYVQQLTQGHNGFLDVAATTGLVGLLMSILAFYVMPLSKSYASSVEDIGFRGLLIGLLAFSFLHNFMESSILRTSQGLWVLLCIVGSACLLITKKDEVMERLARHKRGPHR